MAGRDRIILIHGWRFIPHSYAVVNQFHCLELLKRPGIKLYMNDAPYYSPAWRPQGGLLTPEIEAQLRSIGPLPADVTPDVEMRITYPYDLSSPPRARRTCVFGTAEFGFVPDNFLAGNVPLERAVRENRELVLITPSNWSRDGFLRSGADPDRLFVVPHGIDPAFFHPVSSEKRSEIRRNLGMTGSENDFLFLHLGAMSANKNIALILAAFAQVLRRHPHARLVMKGLDTIYNSTGALQQYAQQLAREDLQLIAPRLHYVSHALPVADVARLYQMSDCYLAPYTGEGFNMPVLESGACGMVVICTAGGATDDFTSADFALPINSTISVSPSEGGRSSARVTIPDGKHFLDRMFQSIEDRAFREKARAAGPAFVIDRFTWKHVVDQLLGVLLPA